MSQPSVADLMSVLREQMAQQQAQLAQQQEQHQQQIEKLFQMMTIQQSTTVTNIPSFPAFDPASELFNDYLARFYTFTAAHSVPEVKTAQLFLTSQTPVIYKLIQNIASQASPPKTVNDLTFVEIIDFMMDQFHPKRFVVRERYKFWGNMRRKAGETIQELSARIRQEAVTCDFSSIKDPLDEAMRTRFMCSVDNEAVLKALFKIKDDELTFARTIQIATEIEDAAVCAKETVFGNRTSSIGAELPTAHRVGKQNKHRRKPSKSKSSNSKQNKLCFRCGKDHLGEECKFINAICRFCGKRGHIQSVCNSKRRAQSTPSPLTCIRDVHKTSQIPQLNAEVQLGDKSLVFEIDTGAGDNFITKESWEQIGKPSLQPVQTRYESASKHVLPTLGKFTFDTSFSGQPPEELSYVVTDVPHLNLLGRSAITQLKISVDELLQTKGLNSVSVDVSNKDLTKACEELCDEFHTLFEPGLGKLKDYELDIKFNEDASPIFHRPRPVPFALREDLSAAIDAGIAKGVWEPVQFNDYGTPVVPIIKKPATANAHAQIRVCGDYSATINPMLSTHRYPIPLPDDLMRKLGGGYGFTKIDLADAYNQIPLSPSSQKRLALSTNKGVLLQKRLAYGISSAPSYFQEIMDKLTRDLPGVAVYIDDILVSGSNAEEHLQNLRRLLQRLSDNGLKCRREKCIFAQQSVEYLGYTLSSSGISKGRKADAVIQMPAPSNVSELRSFLGQVQFYSKFLPNLADILEPLYRLTKKEIKWQWTSTEQQAFETVKELLSRDTVLAHFDPSLQIGISCDASDTGIGAVLFHRYPDNSERPVANVSKTLTPCQRKYSQIQKEALAIIFALTKFHQFLYARKFILVTDHKPLLSIFAPNKATPVLAANRLARWSLTLQQYDYQIEYRKTTEHGNADALSRLPVGPDPEFDTAEDQEDTNSVCLVKSISRQIDPTDPGVIQRESRKDPVISEVMRHHADGWPRESGSDQRHCEEINKFRKIKDCLSCESGCLLYGSRLVIPHSLRQEVLKILHLGHFGMQRMKQLARTAVYWPGIDSQIEDTCRTCPPCAEHQNSPAKAEIHPWILPEKPWSRIHIDHAIDFLGSHWLVVTDAYSKYPCIHATQSTSTKATTDLLEQDFAHFGYPHTIVSDNATTFTSGEFQQWCQDRGIRHLSGAPYHAATNGAAERLIQSFKKSLRKSTLSPKAATQQFLMQYRRTPLVSGLSPSQLLNGRQIRSKIDILLPSPAAIAQDQHLKATRRSNRNRRGNHRFSCGDKCYALYTGPKGQKDPRWVPAVISKVLGPRTFKVCVHPTGPIWKRHLDQLRPRFASDEDNEPGDDYATSTQSNVPQQPQESSTSSLPSPPESPMYGPGNPRKSIRLQNKPRVNYRH